MRWAYAAVAAVAFCGAMAGAAQAADYGAWRVSITGSVSYTWELTSSAPCASTGSGAVKATMRGRSGRFRIGYFTRGGFRHWLANPRLFRVRGRISRTDDTRQNPPEDEFHPCPSVDKSGCVMRPLSRYANATVEGMNTRRTPGITISFNNLMNAFDDVEGSCDRGGFHDFTSFIGRPRAHYAQLVGRMPSPARVRQRRAFTVGVVKTSRGRDGGYRATTVRRATLRFQPA